MCKFKLYIFPYVPLNNYKTVRAIGPLGCSSLNPALDTSLINIIIGTSYIDSHITIRVLQGRSGRVAPLDQWRIFGDFTGRGSILNNFTNLFLEWFTDKKKDLMKFE